jgi:spore germination cell wall hydrolase CwlJ-like protein
MKFYHDFGTHVDILARTLYGEARSQPLDGIKAVACVVMNRARRGGWWGASPQAVCLAPKQFSCWNDDDPNKAIITAVASGNLIFDVCIDVAERAVLDMLHDATKGACHYHTKGVHPQWSMGKTPSATIGDHLFFNDVE